MIDWVTIRIPVTLPAPIAGGYTVKLDQAGQVVGTFPHRLSVEGSFSSSLTIRAPSVGELELSGNPTKWLAGHNLYGTDDLTALVWATVQRLEPHLGCSLAEAGLHGPESLAAAILTRVDCTEMLALPSLGDVRSFIRSAELTGTMSHRGRGVMRSGTLVFGHASGKNAARSQLVLYSKGQEVLAPGHQLPDLLSSDPEVTEWVNQCLRIEARLFRLELQQQNLNRLASWSNLTAKLQWSAVVAKLSFSDVLNTGNFDLEKLPQNLRGTFATWETGRDVRQLLSKATFYRHRLAIRKLTGVDISVPVPRPGTAQIVPIKCVLEAVPVGRPVWADRIDQQLRSAGCFTFDDLAA